MKINMGTIDRIIRTILALLVIVFYLTGDLSGLAALILGIFALIFLVTSFIGFCPLYKLLNVSTKQKSTD
jgi:Na+(H+)/acetate symporter ActP